MNRYENTTILKTPNTNRPYYKGKFYPNIPLSESDVYVITTIGDRLDSLAFSYYNDATLWWIISAANNNITKGALYPLPGTQLRIPTDINNVLNLYDQFNKAR
jgi:nucleoid-associated protein YgaU